MRAVLACLVVFAACDNPPLSLRFRLTGGESQQCYSDDNEVTTSCQDVTMLCSAYLSVRVLNPSDPTAPYISVCKPLTGAQQTLCSIAGIDLPQPAMPIPEQTLEVQMAVFPESAIKEDPDTREKVCPPVEFGANGLPLPVRSLCDELADPFGCPVVPAVGGRAFYHPGDDKTIIDLGCTDLEQLTDAEVCNKINLVTVTGTVADFDNLVSSIDKPIADRLNVGVGEPKPLGDTHELSSNLDYDLELTAASSPTWSATIQDPNIKTTACLEVREDAAESTTALTCRVLDDPDADFELPGVLLKRALLSTILSAIGLSKFPTEGGLVVGIVLDENYTPLAGRQVTCGIGCTSTIQYLADDRASVVTGGTSASGVFVSRDAPYGTVFTLTTPGADPAFGGIVEGKVTIVILRDKGSVVGGG